MSVITNADGRIDRPVHSRRRALLHLTIGIALEIMGACIAIYGVVNESIVVFFAGLLVALLGILALLHLGFDATVFRYQYGPFGPQFPRRFPDAWTPITFAASFAGIGYAGFRASFPLATWYVGTEGVGLKVVGLSPIFIASKEIVSFENRFSLLFPASYMHHQSEEVATPLLMPREVAESYSQLMKSPFAKVLK